MKSFRANRSNRLSSTGVRTTRGCSRIRIRLHQQVDRLSKSQIRAAIGFGAAVTCPARRIGAELCHGRLGGERTVAIERSTPAREKAPRCAKNVTVKVRG